MRNDDSSHQTNNMAQLLTLVFSVQLFCFLMILLTWPNYSTAANRFTTNEDGEINQLRNSVVTMKAKIRLIESKLEDRDQQYVNLEKKVAHLELALQKEKDSCPKRS
ncbi:uncharacterized protein LOC124209373 [Daphnia pulex]|uniref:uncharacterized protein LOC124209373 n=1 Tax=Daphnia pulex TaxID=6669 RepID=UPI001EE07627|nr:uncharacterized protein LOC124209373 [Daphnia pulex]